MLKKKSLEFTFKLYIPSLNWPPYVFSGLFGSYPDSTVHCSSEDFSVGESPLAVSKNQTQTWTQTQAQHLLSLKLSDFPLCMFNNVYCRCM